MGSEYSKQQAYEAGLEAGRSGNSYEEMCARLANEIVYDEEEMAAWEAGFEAGQEEDDD